MDHLRELVREAHRRSLWQVLGVYIVSSWLVLEVVDTLTGVLGLPDWVPPVALVLLLIGLPIVMATAVVQEGGPGRGARTDAEGSFSDQADKERPAPREAPEGADLGTTLARTSSPSDRSLLQRHLTWPRAIGGGVAAFSLLALLVGGYFVSWSLGIGPVGSLLAAGELEEGDWIVVADFEGAAGDPELGLVVSEALRTDFAEHPTVRVADGSQVREALELMQAPDAERLTASLAEEVAVREGMAAVLEGEVAEVGTGYVLTAILRSAESGETLVRLRENAAGPDDLIPGIGRLSERLRERAGEPLRSIRAGPGLEQATTSSLQALRLYSDATRAQIDGDHARAIRLLEDAVEVDPEFGAAWLRLAVNLRFQRADGLRRQEAAVRAYELRHRLSERERLYVEGSYHLWFEEDRDAAAEAFRRLLDIVPDHAGALNGLARISAWRSDFDGAIELLERAVGLPGSSSDDLAGLIVINLARGHLDEAREALERLVDRYPDYPLEPEMRARVRFHEGDDAGARAVLEGALAEEELDGATRSRLHWSLGPLLLWRGRIGPAREHLAEGERAAAAVDDGLRQRFRVDAASMEVMLGDPDRGGRMLREEVPEAMVEFLGTGDRLFRIFGLAWIGDGPGAEAVLDAWQAAIPAGERGSEQEAGMNAARAAIHIAEGRAREAVETIESVRISIGCPRCGAYIMGWALREAGHLEEAGREWEWSTTPKETQANPYFPVFHLWAIQRLAPLYEELGETERALHYYRRLVELWEDADPELQPQVEHARERIAALEIRETGGG